MTNPKTYLTASILLACLSLIALFAGLALPSIERANLRDQIQSNSILTRETARSWGEVPGIRNISYQKTFVVYDLEANADQILSGKVNVKDTTPLVYDYAYTYKDLQFAPASNSSIQYHKMYSHTFHGADENILKNITVKTLNIGALKGMTQQADMSRAQLFVQSLFKIYTSFQQNIVTLIITDYVYNFYIKNQTLTYTTIFTYHDTVSPALADTIWNDPSYGWSQSLTLAPWVNIVLGYIDIPGYDPTTNPNYAILKTHFGLTDAQMMALIGATPLGQVGPSSQLYLVALAVQTSLSGTFGCKSSLYCTQTELFSYQFFDASVTKNPLFEGIPPRDSVSELNLTYPVPPEIAAVTKGQEISFRQDLQTSLFGLLSDLSGPAPGHQSLFSTSNVEVIINNQNNPQAVQSYFNLDTNQQAQVLIDYVDYIVDKFAYQGHAESLSTYKYMADITASSMNRLQVDLANLLLVNVTAIGIHSGCVQANLTCASILTQDISASQALIDSICNNPDLTMDSSEGLTLWVAAYYGGEGSAAYAYIESATGIIDTDLQTILNPTSHLGGIMQNVVNAISAALDCGQSPCEAAYISQLQWTTSNFTMQLPEQYFGKTYYETIADIFPEYFDSLIPEFSIYAKRVLNQTVSLDADLAGELFSYNTGSINNNYEVLYLFSLANQKNYTEILNRFKFDNTTLNALLSYFDSVFINYYLGGLTKTRSIYDLLWGYEDPFLLRLNNTNFFENVQLFSTKVNILGDKENSATYSNESYNMINSGATTLENVRLTSTYKGNQTLSLTKAYFDGSNYVSQYVLPWGAGLQYINGTDGGGFKPLLKESEPIAIFESSFVRNLNLNYKTQFSYGPHGYEFYQYKLDTQQLNASDIYHTKWDGYINTTALNDTPILVSLPYFKGCDQNSYSQITYDGKPASSFQDDVDQWTFVVESLTGNTANYTKDYQYSITNMIPLLTTQVQSSAIPIMAVSEAYVTPDSIFDSDLRAYYSKYNSIKTLMVVCLILAAVLIIIAVLLLVLYRKNKSRFAFSHMNESPAGDYRSLHVDSVGGDGSFQPRVKD